MKKKVLYITLSLVLFLVSCSKEISPSPREGDRQIEISFSVDNFFYGKTSTRATHEGSEAEREIGNLYLFLFDNTGANPFKYYIDNSIFSGGTWNAADKTIKLDKTQTEAGSRKVYIVANIDAAMKSELASTNTVSDFENVLKTTQKPWSPDLGNSLLMFGSKNHNFIDQHILNSVPLERAVAKIEINVKLRAEFQIVPEVPGGNLTEYRYRYVNFDKNTYIVKPNDKPDNLINSTNSVWPDLEGWTPWGASLNGNPKPDTGAGYTSGNDGMITGLKLITYVNERDNPGASIEIALQRVDGGMLPPPEFGPELYRLPLSDKIQRNYWYQYDIEI